MSTPQQIQPPFCIQPLVFLTFACTMAMMSFTALLGPIGRSVGLEPWQMGSVLTLSGFAWVAAARPWGMASDHHGRRPVLLWGVGGFAIAFGGLCLFTAWVLDSGASALMAFGGLLVGRALAGAFYAAAPTAGAALVADSLPAEKRSAAMATIGMASGTSMVIGPAASGLLAPLGLPVPLALCAGLPLIAFLTIWVMLPRHPRPERTGAPPPPRFTDPRLRGPVVVAFASMFAVAAAQIVVGFFAIDRLALTPEQGAHVAGLALTAVGVALTLVQLGVRLLPWSPQTTIRVGAVLAAAGFAAVCLVEQALALYACYFVAASGMGLIWPSVSTWAANAVTPDEQGTAAGTITAAQGLGTIAGPLCGTALYGLDITAPYGLIATVLLAVLLLPGRQSG